MIKISLVKKILSVVCLAGCLVVSGFRMTEINKIPNYGEEQKRVVDLIEKREYGNGYGSFWCASSVSYFSNYVISIYPISVRNSLRIYPYHELIKRDWYEETDKHFVIIQKGEDVFVDRELLFKILGKPDDDFQTENYEVYYWQEDISRYLIS